MKNTVFIALAALIIGGAVGYFVIPHKSEITEVEMDQMMGHQMDQMTSHLEGLEGDDLDRAFLEDMIVHHQGAIAMAKKVLKSTQRDELKTLASDIVNAQTKEIDIMNTWLISWFGGDGDK